MSVRFLSNAGRIIMSKAGYDASPALADQFKLFDSNWGATGLVIMTGTAFKATTSPLVIPFPYPLHYEPAAEAYAAPNGQANGGFAYSSYTTKNALVVVGNNNSNVYVRYVVWAVSI